MAEMYEGTFDPINGYNTFDINNSNLINASSDPLENEMINLIVSDSNLQTSAFFLYKIQKNLIFLIK